MAAGLGLLHVNAAGIAVAGMKSGLRSTHALRSSGVLGTGGSSHRNIVRIDAADGQPREGGGVDTRISTCLVLRLLFHGYLLQRPHVHAFRCGQRVVRARGLAQDRIWALPGVQSL